MAWMQSVADALWQCTLPVVLVALAATLLCRLTPTRPSTRHMLWVIVLAWFVAPAVLPQSWMRVPWETVATFTTSDGHRDEQATTTSAPDLRESVADAARDVATPGAANVESTCVSAGSPVHIASEPTIPVADCAAAPVPAATLVSGSTPRHATLALEVRLSDAPVAATHRTATDCDASPTVTTSVAHETTAAYEPPSRVAPVAPVEELSDVAAKWWSATLVSARAGIGAWLAAGEVIFASAVKLPAVPPAVWIAGAALLAALHVLSIVRFVRLTNTKIQTPPWVQRETDRLARRLGLAQSPRVLMVDANISPLVWCGVNPVMYVPVKLWLQLDDIGRRAVICHELAHLKRRDHWICWLEVLVTLLFWWHPVVWWVRRRIHEEADLCCDSWVTWLLPQGRRAYAEALLRTRTYVGRAGSCTPTAGLAVTSSGARELSRRITMVMTQRFGPRSSAVGMGMAAILIGLGWAVTPALSCPPEEAAARKKAIEAEQRAPIAFTQSTSVTAQPTPPTPVEAPLAPVAPPVRARGGSAAPAPHATTYEAHVHGQAADGPAEYRPYNMSKAKLSLFWKLMSRDDVPIYVRNVDEDTIEIQATPRQHEIFREFFRMIDPDNKQSGAAAGPAPARAVAPRAFNFGWGQNNAELAREQQARAEASRAQAEMRRAQADAHRAQMDAGRDQARAAREQSRAIEKQAEALRKQAEKLREEAEKLREKAESLEEDSSSRTQLEQRADSIEASADSVDAQAETLDAQLAALEEAGEASEMADAEPAELDVAVVQPTPASLFDPVVVQPSIEDHRKLIDALIKEQTEAQMSRIKDQIQAQWQQSIRDAIDQLRSEAGKSDNDAAANVLRDLAEKLEAQIRDEASKPESR